MFFHTFNKVQNALLKEFEKNFSVTFNHQLCKCLRVEMQKFYRRDMLWWGGIAHNKTIRNIEHLPNNKAQKKQ